MKQGLVILGILVMLLSLMASAQSGTASTPGGTATITEGNNTFALSLYRALSSDKGENLFFSPYSISTALAMTYLGARGDTAREMAGTLNFTVPPEKFHRAYGDLIRGINEKGQQKNYELVVANRLWGQTGYHFLKPFLDGEKNYYGASLEQLDFSREPEKSRVAINKWVEDRTNQKIKDLIPRGMPMKDMSLVLTNAIYFKAQWEEQFRKGLTVNEPFHVSSAIQEIIPMMKTEKHFSYGRFNDVDIVELPYRSDELSMVVILPRDREGLPKVEKTLDYGRLKTMLGALAPRKVNLSLPRFKTTCSFGLADTLRKMGMKAPFESGRADFSGMDGTKKLYISAILHKAFVDVNEEGTEAAAATAVMMVAGCAMPKEEVPVVMKIDHPFLFLIRDNATGSILFMGRINRPGKQ